MVHCLTSKLLRMLLGALCVCLLPACVSRADIEAITKTQSEILGKLDRLEKALPAAPAGLPAPPPGPDPGKAYAVAVEDSATLGPDDAWVTVVLFSDFQCPFCSSAAATMKDLRAAYGKDLRLVFKHNPLPFHGRAIPAAIAAECAGEQDKFWEMHDKLFANPKKMEEADLAAMARELGLDGKKFSACQAGSRAKKRLEDDQAQARQFGSRGTPNFFINGHFLAGAQRLQVFKQLVDTELQRARDSGVERREYYRRAVEEKGAKSI